MYPFKNKFLTIKAKYYVIEPYYMAGSTPDGPVMYSGSYTCFINTISIEKRRRHKQTTVKLSTTTKNIERDVLNSENKQLLVLIAARPSQVYSRIRGSVD